MGAETWSKKKKANIIFMFSPAMSKRNFHETAKAL